jgi:serine/threonine protein kinase/formylglycine-generating enzyme required for sulfatase activity
VTNPNDTQSLFAEWLARREEGRGEPFESMLAQNPAHVEGLRAMHAGWSFASNRHEKVRRHDESLSNRLFETFGSGVDPKVSLDRDAEKSTPGADGESTLYDDLRARSDSSGRYRHEAKIAEGGMGAIHRVYDKDLRRVLAMKVMLEEKQGRLSRFLEEAQVTGQLDHPGIVPVHELGIDSGGRVFFTMKLVKGKDLREVFDMVKVGVDGWNLTRALSVILRVCEAMAFAHEKRVIHRDLKPGNVMVGRHGEVYVMDWGLARVLGMEDTKDVRLAPVSQSVVNTERRESAARRASEDTPDSPLLTLDGDAIGTPSYMPIEQVEGNLAMIGPHSDVYAVGAMLYHLLAGHAPYVETNDYVSARLILGRALAGPPEPIRNKATAAPAELIAICEKAMAREVPQRYATMAELGDDLRAYLERRVVKAYKTGVVAETRMWIARNRALASAILVAFILLGGFAWQQRNAAASDRERASALDRVLQLADVKELRDLQARGNELLVDRGAVYRSNRTFDSLLASMNQWIADAESVAVRLSAHEATLETIESRGRRSGDGSTFEFESKEDSWWHSAVAELVTGFRSLTLDDPSAISTRAMRDRIVEFKTIYTRSVVEHATEWATCVAMIADPAQCPEYKGLEIAPQIGLAPIGRDPRSGLWEFWFVDATGVKPEHGADGKLVLTDDFGLVFVLLPGGPFWMGAQSADPNGHNFDPLATSDQGPVHEVSLAPFFLSKYEMTEHQWILASRDESWPYGVKNRKLPAHSISWDDAAGVLPALCLALPTEAQWEYGCRAGASTLWSTGNEKASLLGSANVEDKELTDDYQEAATVGSLMPNSFGLHDMHGNLWEWCLDGIDGEGDYAKPCDPRTGEHQSDRPRGRVGRGGAYWGVAELTQSAYRYGFDPGLRYGGNGIRPRRDLMSQ